MNRRIHPLLLSTAVALGAAGVVAASDLGKYDALFPSNPCQDGWVACLDGTGQEINPEPLTDAIGVPSPADARLGWFDLKPTAVFSPFIVLSEYPEDEPLPPRADEGVADAADNTEVNAEIARLEEERRRIEVERQAAAEFQVGGQAPQHDVGVRDRGSLSATSVARRAGIGAR